MALTRVHSLMITVVLLCLLMFLGIWSAYRPQYSNTTLIDKSLPDISVPHLENPQISFSPQSKLGNVWMLNVWATWCTGCRAEHQTLAVLADQYQLDIVGLNYKDERPDATQWLEKLGNPYSVVIEDPQGDMTAPWEIDVLPTTYIIDSAGMIRFSHVGPIDSQLVNNVLLPTINRLKVSSSRKP